MVRWEEAEGGFFCRRDYLWGEMLYVKAMNTAIERQWKNLYNIDRKRRRSRWAHFGDASSCQNSGKEYVQECRRAKAVAAEARQFYDFHGEPGPIPLASESGSLEPDVVARSIPLKQSDGGNPMPSLS